MPSILFVCLGNICRSPMAEGLARKMAAERGLTFDLDSAGTAAYHAGERPDPRTRQILADSGAPFGGRARQVTADDFGRFDLILAMDSANLANLQKICPEKHLHKLRLTLEPIGGGDVPDPYYGGPAGFEANRAMLAEALEVWFERAEVLA